MAHLIILRFSSMTTIHKHTSLGVWWRRGRFDDCQRLLGRGGRGAIHLVGPGGPVADVAAGGAAAEAAGAAWRAAGRLHLGLGLLERLRHKLRELLHH